MRRLHDTRSVLLLVLLGLAFSACDGGDSSPQIADTASCRPAPEPDVRQPPPDITSPDSTAPGDDARAPDAGAPKLWALPPCERACDRFVDCAVDACAGFEWVTAGVLAESCHGACDDGFADAADDAPDCATLLDTLAADVPAYGQRCDEDPCVAMCTRVAECVVTECPALAGAEPDPLRDDCIRTCNPDEAGWVSAYPTCAALVDVISQSDAAFREACEGAPVVCPEPDQCEAYGARVAACLVETCEGRADAYAPGLAWAFSNYCQTAEPCLPLATIAPWLDPAQACDEPPLVDAGQHPPLAGLCQGTNGVAPETIAAACDEVMACGGGTWLPDADACMALIVLREDAAAISGCLLAAGDCGALYECFEEGE